MPRARARRSPPRPRTTRIVDETVELGPGQERHIRFQLLPADTITITCKARTKFYAGFFTREDYVTLVNADGPGMFRFEFGTDDKGFTTRSPIEASDAFFLVLRNGVFSPRIQVSVEVSLQRVGRVEPTIRSG